MAGGEVDYEKNHVWKDENNEKEWYFTSGSTQETQNTGDNVKASAT